MKSRWNWLKLQELDDAEADNQKTTKWVKSRIDKLVEQMDYLIKSR